MAKRLQGWQSGLMREPAKTPFSKGVTKSTGQARTEKRQSARVRKDARVRISSPAYTFSKRCNKKCFRQKRLNKKFFL